VGAPESDALKFVGEGDCPPDFDRVNWAAFIFAPFWSVGYGPKPWGRIIWAVLLAPIVVENAVLLFVSTSAFEAVRQVLDPLEIIVWLPLWAYYGYNVDRWIWQRESARIEQHPDLPTKLIPLAKYRRSRRFWTRVWLVFLLLGMFGNIGLLATGRVTWRDLAPIVGYLVIAALFVLDRRRTSLRA